MADGSLTPAQTAARPYLKGYRCAECDQVTHLADLNDDMVCEACAGPLEDPESVIDCSPAAMLREHGTWG